MAQRSPHFCGHQGCSVLVTDTYCADHASLHELTDNRAGPDERGYDSRWRKVRERYISHHPLCELCEAKNLVVIANVVHHKVPLSEGGQRLSLSNLQALCRSCHEILHGRKRAGDGG